MEAPTAQSSGLPAPRQPMPVGCDEAQKYHQCGEEDTNITAYLGILNSPVSRQAALNFPTSLGEDSDDQ